MRTILIDDRDTLSSTDPNPSFFSTFYSFCFTLSSSSPVPTSSLTSKIDHVRFVATSTGVITFTGPLNTLDTPSSFDHIFRLNSIMIQIIPRSKRQCTTEETEYLASKVLAFCNLCRLHIFCNCI